tara:strand:+ start:7219 stop:8988 length:1770 start_codon:yes stop_codon:yes gene_type:complete
MSANTYLQVSELDFDEIRTNLKTYLSSQDQFKDYSFEGSAMAVLLDVLAYNTHYNAYYLNMVGNEMFLDTAQQRDSVVSRAKELGYTPVSSVGAQAEVSLTVSGVDSTVTQITIPKNAKFTTTFDDVTYTYVNPAAKNIAATSVGVFTGSLTIKEGEPLAHSWTVSASNPVRYILPNAGVDTTSVTVTVQESSSDSTVVEFYRASNITQIYSTSPIYFIEEAADKKYEIIFGSGSLGKSLKAGNIVKVDYLVNNGEETNGADSFSVDSLDIGTAYSSATITSVSSSALGGRPQETVESIKFQAPRNYQTQNRAVIASDYERILLSENPDLQSVIAFGGEQATPAVFGKVYIAVKPFGERFATQNRKQSIKTSIVDRTPLAVDPVIIDADYTYIIPTITTYYDVTKSSLNDSAVAANVRDAITTFSTSNLGRFGNKLRFSRFVRSLDDTSDGYVLNNDATIKIEKRVTPNLNVAELVSLRFNNAIRPGSMGSSEFTYNGFSAFLGDDGLGTISIFRYSDSKERVNIIPVAGTVDYVTGIVTIENFLPSAFSDLELRINVSPENLDIIPIREQILLLNSPDAIINVVGEQT